MDSKSRSAQRGVLARGLVDLGDEPPLSVDGAARLIDKRRVSLRWYSGIILNGLCGAALMGGAVYVALDGEAFFAAMPERAEAARTPAQNAERTQNVSRKTDRLASTADGATARQVMRIATALRQGEREVVRIKPVVRVSANLSLTTSELSAAIPPFNAARLLAGPSGATAAPSDESPAEDAEISFVTRDLGPLLQRAKIAGAVSFEDVTARVREAANWIGRGAGPALANAATGSGKLAYAVEGAPDPYAGFETRIVPENITLLPKTASQANGGNGGAERTVLVKRGENVTTILRDLGAAADDIKAIVAALGARGRDGGVKEGQKLRILASPGPGGRIQLLRVIVASDAGPEAAIALSDIGKYVAVEVHSAETQVTQADADDDDNDDTGAVRLYQSIYETALRQQVPRSVIDEIIRIYSYDVDFQRRVQPGDSFEILFPGEEDTPGEARGDVMFASLTVNGETKRYYRFVTPDDGTVDYYDESGKSAKKFLVRKPVGAGIMRSSYGWRRHPILGYSKMHTGVDWAAPRGTPIYASGGGVVERVGWEGGYGKYVRLKHAYGYETAYGHMSAFARGIQQGSKVRQGQVIGYVGSTGLSTGAHVHYEILVNGRFVDPNRIKLPRGRSLEGALLANFEQERERVDTMMNRTGGRAAELAPASAKPRKEAAAKR